MIWWHPNSFKPLFPPPMMWTPPILKAKVWISIFNDLRHNCNNVKSKIMIWRKWINCSIKLKRWPNSLRSVLSKWMTIMLTKGQRSKKHRNKTNTLKSKSLICPNSSTSWPALTVKKSQSSRSIFQNTRIHKNRQISRNLNYSNS